MRAGNKILAAAVLPLLLAAGLGAVEITGADFPGKAPAYKADVSFCGGFSVKNISFQKDAVVMPLTEYGGRSYSDIKLLSKNLYWKLQACLAKGKCASGARSAAPAVKVGQIRPLRSETRLANAEVSIDGELLVVLGLMKSRYGGLWVAYPSNFKVKNAKLKSAIAIAVKEAYSRASAETQDK